MRVPSQQRDRRRCGQQFENALTPAFVRNVAKAGRYADGYSRKPASDR
jgi:hypothetical protein